MSQSMNKKSILSMVLLSTLILSQAAPVFATVQEEITEPKTELVTETPTVENEDNAEAPPTDGTLESYENKETLESSEKVTEANTEQIPEDSLSEIAPVADTSFTGGNGSETTPYLISTQEDLELMRDSNYLTKGFYFKLVNNLTLTGAWSPIGNLENSFVGHFDGGGYTISGLSVHLPDTLRVGLFGSIINSTIKNINLESVNVTGYRFVGGLAGRIESSTISKSSVSGNIQGIFSGDGTYVGGLVGSNSLSTIQTSHSSALATGFSYVGGLVGTSYGTVLFSYSTGAVNGQRVLGGLIGYSDYGEVFSNHSTGTVSGVSDSVGGLIGHLQGGNVSKNIATGNLTITSPNWESSYQSYGAIVGYWVGGTMGTNYRFNQLSATISGSTILTSTITPRNGEYLTPSQLRDSTTFSGTPLNWLNQNTWQWDSERNIPILGFGDEQDTFPIAPVMGKTINVPYSGRTMSLDIADLFNFDGVEADDFEFKLVGEDERATLSQERNQLSLSFDVAERIGTYQIEAIPNGTSRLAQRATVATINIKPKAIKFSHALSLIRPFDGTIIFTVTNSDIEDIELDGVFENDDVIADLVGLTGMHTVEGTPTANVSNGLLAFDPISLTGLHAMNYTLAAQPTINTEITQAPQPLIPVISDISTTATTLTINTEALTLPTNYALEYAISTVSDLPTMGWQASNTFEGLHTNGEYHVWVRVAEHQNHLAGEAATGTAHTDRGIFATDTAVSEVYAGRTMRFPLSDLFELADGLSADDYIFSSDVAGSSVEIDGTDLVLSFDTVGDFIISAKGQNGIEADKTLTITPKDVTFADALNLTRAFDGTSDFTITDDDVAGVYLSGVFEDEDDVEVPDLTNLVGVHTVDGKEVSDVSIGLLSFEPIDTTLGGEQGANYFLSAQPVINTEIVRADNAEITDLSVYKTTNRVTISADFETSLLHETHFSELAEAGVTFELYDTEPLIDDVEPSQTFTYTADNLTNFDPTATFAGLESGAEYYVKAFFNKTATNFNQGDVHRLSFRLYEGLEENIILDDEDWASTLSLDLSEHFIPLEEDGDLENVLVTIAGVDSDDIDWDLTNHTLTIQNISPDIEALDIVISGDLSYDDGLRPFTLNFNLTLNAVYSFDVILANNPVTQNINDFEDSTDALVSLFGATPLVTRNGVEISDNYHINEAQVEGDYALGENTVTFEVTNTEIREITSKIAPTQGKIRLVDMQDIADKSMAFEDFQTFEDIEAELLDLFDPAVAGADSFDTDSLTVTGFDEIESSGTYRLTFTATVNDVTVSRTAELKLVQTEFQGSLTTDYQGQNLIFDATALINHDFDTTVFDWTITDLPSGSTATVSPTGEENKLQLSVANVGKYTIVGTRDSANHSDMRQITLNITINPLEISLTGDISLSRVFDGTADFTISASDVEDSKLAGVIEDDEVNADLVGLSGVHTVDGAPTANVSSGLLDFDPVSLTGAHAMNYSLTQPVINTVITQATRDNQFELNLGVESFSHNHVSLSYTLTHLGLAERLMTPMNFTSLTRAEVDDTPRVEYAYSATNSITGVTWQNSPTFTDLQPNTTYHFFARVAETNNFHATAHEVLSLRTNALGNVTVPEEIEDGNGGGSNEQNFTTGAENVEGSKNLPSTGDVLESLFGLLGTGVLVGILTWLRQRKN
ncbi:MAG: hypothetical protein FWH31_01730 [Streptococcaceae bacterium]|nr:hypothetical protein [Streptococcaceae bacterium]